MPKGGAWEMALSTWRRLPSDKDAQYDREVVIPVTDIDPQLTWGTSPQDVVPITGVIPNPDDAPDDDRRAAWARSLEYMDLKPGTRMSDNPHRQGVHRLVHQRPHRGSARRPPPSPATAGSPTTCTP